MKKALHDEEKVYFSFREGEISAWSTHDMETLLAAANDVPEYEIEERMGFQVLLKDGEVVLRQSPEEAFCQILHDWMHDIVDNGITDDLIEELNDVVGNTRYIHVLMLSKEGKPFWQNNIADLNRSPDVLEAAGYAFAHQLAIGGLEGLRRCQLPDCEKFFIGRPNAKWCSKSCGSKHRVRQKRKKDFR